MKTGLIGFLIFIVLAGSLGMMVNKLFNVIDEEKTEMGVIIGEDVVINGDTLVIVDYKMLTEKYVLSNGVEISEDYVNKLTEK